VKRLERLPVRWRLALTSAGLTFAILLLFAVIIGLFTARQVRSSFDDDLRLTAIDLSERIHPFPSMGSLQFDKAELRQAAQSAAGDAVIRIVGLDGKVVIAGDPHVDLGVPSQGVSDVGDYRVASRPLRDPRGAPVAAVQYAKPLSHLRHTMARIKLFLILGVIGGTALALLAGLALARRAMAPIARLTEAAKTIARTRDAGVVKMPKPAADDEVADLARTLEEMLMALDQARSETQSALDRQRRFVADASHELRTPLTSILANLELLESELEGEDAEIAASALRSSRRMRRLVADLLLLARADAGRVSRREPLDAGWVVREAAGEAAPLARGHGLTVDVQPGEKLVVEGAADELHRLVLNLIQNALVHTPEGTAVDVRARRDGDRIAIEVSDEGPGIPPEMRARIFDRFVRGEGDRNGSNGGSGLGLSIVRAVAESHDGSVELGESEGGGARFTVLLPAAGSDHEEPPGSPAAPEKAGQRG
jgi:two-component system OmpR family sensor kinase